jgi:UDP-N-acetyl-D-mannosaminuronic acid dehydrogenase
MVPTSFPDRHVCVLGLGYVGLTLSVALAKKGFIVRGVEIRRDVLDLLEEGRPHFHEAGLDQQLTTVIANGSFTFSQSMEGRHRASVYIITVGTPLDAMGQARTDLVSNVASDIGGVIEDGDIVILRSTVKLGTTRDIVLPILRRSGKQFQIACCPERTLEGRALAELDTLPQIVGADDFETAHRAAQLFSFVTATIVRVSSLEAAEMIKLVDNTARDVGFAFANEIARACDATGLSAAEIIRAGKLGYPRTNLPLPGPVGGPCLEKDPHILHQSLAGRIDMKITAAARQVNEDQPRQIAQFIAATLEPRLPAGTRPVIALMGLAFKGEPETDDIRGTMARPIMRALLAALPGAEMRGYDPVVKAPEIQSLGLFPAASMREAVTGAHAALILNNHPAFRAMRIEELATALAEPGLFYDCWNLFSEAELRMPPNRAYFALGSHGKPKFTRWN